MKNANSRFVRVLAIVLVVLMVVPAALVGCGSNKANNAAISEALAAAEAARKEAEEAKAAADAAAAEAAAKAAEEAAKLLEEANKKAEEALKAAEEAQKALEEAQKTTAAPVTQAPVSTEDMKVVADYAYKVLNDNKLDFLKARLMYVYDISEEDIMNDNLPESVVLNPEYAIDDIEEMEKLYGTARIAIYKATTVDYINQIVANYVAALEATPTYVERVIEKYEAIDFASNYDVLDVVKAYNYVKNATLSADAEKELTAYGEDEIDVLLAINTEYVRYTGDLTVDYNKDVVEADDVLYEDMYLAAKDVIAAVKLVFDNAEKLDVDKIVYNADIEDLLEDAVAEYDKWNNKFFVKADDAELVKYYEAFRQAFVGEAYVAEYDNDYAWEATVAAGERVEELLAAVAEADALVKMIKSIAGYDIDAETFKYTKYVAKVTEAKAALDAWKAKYSFEDDAEGNEDPNVKAIIEAKTAGIYDSYKTKSLVIEYFDYLAKTVAAVNVDAFIDASEEKLNDVDYNFNFKKYGSAVAAALEWFYGKEKTTGNFVGGFKNIDVVNDSALKYFKALGADYNVAALITADDASIKLIFDNAFGVEDASALFAAMKTSYDRLALAKKKADAINEDLEELVEMGETLKVLPEYNKIFKADFEKFDEADDDEKAAVLTADCGIKTWATENGIVIGDDNFNSMIDWAAVETIYNNYRASLETVVADAAKVALEYITWQAAVGTGAAVYNVEDEQIEFTYGGTKYTFSDLKPAQIDVYSYDRIKNVIALEKTLEDLFDPDNKEIVETLSTLPAELPDDEGDLKIALTSVVSFCSEMVAEFYTVAQAVGDFALASKAEYPIVDQASYSDNDWKHHKTTKADMAEVALLNRTGEDYETLRPLISTALGNYLWVSEVGYGSKRGTTASNSTAVYATSYQGAVYSVDPMKYAIKNADGKVTGLDSTAYKAALDKAVASMYTKWFAEYLKDFNTQDKLTMLVNDIAVDHLNYGLWTIEGDFEIDDELYTYTVNSTGKAYVLTIYDSSDEKKEGNAISFKIGTNEYTVTFSTEISDGKFALVPALTAGELPAEYADVCEFIDVKAEDLVYDVRDYADAIGANYDKFSNKKIGSNSTLDELTAAQLKAIFDAEAKNDFYVAFETLRARMYVMTSASDNSWMALGDYIASGIELDDALKASIEAVSKLARDDVYAMTPEANTIADIEKEFNKYATRVKAILADNGYTVVEEVAADGYMQITAITPVAE